MRPPWKWLGTGAAAAGVAVGSALAARARRRPAERPATIVSAPEPEPPPARAELPPSGAASLVAALDELERTSRALWQATSLAEPFVSADVRRLARGSRRLLDLLAERREFEELRAAARAERDVLGHEALARLEAAITRRQTRLARKLVKEGQELYATKPSRVAGRLGAGGFTDR